MSRILMMRPGDADFHLFDELPRALYPADSVRFKLPDTLNLPLFDSCYVLKDAGVVKARAALYNNPLQTYNGQKAFCVGNYESVDDQGVSTELLQRITEDAKAKGAEFLIGPMNGSTWENYRFSTHHDQPNFFLEPYHHLYYNQQFLNAGFDIIGKYFSSKNERITPPSPELFERQEELEKIGVTFRSIDLAHFENELERIHDLNEIAFKTNFLYTPIAKEYFIKKYAEARSIIDPDLVVVAEGDNKRVIGFLFCVPDLFNRREKSLIVKTAARHPDRRWRGLGHVMFNIVCDKAISVGYTSVIHAFMYEEGTSVGINNDFEGAVFKNYVLYGKPL